MCARPPGLTTVDYLWRWDPDWFWVSQIFPGLRSGLVRRLLGEKYLRSDVYKRCSLPPSPQTPADARALTHTHTHMHARTHARTHTETYRHTRTCARAFTSRRTQTHSHPQTDTHGVVTDANGWLTGTGLRSFNDTIIRTFGQPRREELVIQDFEIPAEHCEAWIHSHFALVPEGRGAVP